MPAECCGTILCPMNRRMEARPRRWSNQPGSLSVDITGSVGIWLSSPRDNHIITAQANGVFFQWRGGRPRKDFPVQIVRAVVTGAPDLTRIVAKLDCAVAVSYTHLTLP